MKVNGISCIALVSALLAASAVSAQDSAPLAPPSLSLGSLLQQAESLVKSGRHLEAYTLLERSEGDYSGDVGFDYLLAVAALDSGKLDRATMAFERVLAINPDFAGARLDLARAFMGMGNDSLARLELETVLNQSPPDSIKAVVQKYLQGIDERRQSRLQRLTGYIESSFASDSNLTAVTSDFSKGVQSTFGIDGVLPTGSSILTSGSTSGLAAGIGIVRVLGDQEQLTVFAGADWRTRFYADLAGLNFSNLDVRAGISAAIDNDTYRLFATMGQYRQDGITPGINANRDTAALGGDWQHKITDSDQVSVSVQYSQPRFATQATQDTDQTLFTGAWLHAFDASFSPMVFASLMQSADRAVRPLATGSDVSRSTTGLRTHLQITPKPDIDCFLSLGITRRSDDTANARSALALPVYGQDVAKDVTLGLTWRPAHGWTVKAQMTTYQNDSNLPLYEYRRTEDSVLIRYDI